LEIQDVDFTRQGEFHFIHFLLIRYKIHILDEYFLRRQVMPTVDMEQPGLVGVGLFLLNELFTFPPQGVDVVLDKMLRDDQKVKEKQKLVQLQMDEEDQNTVLTHEEKRLSKQRSLKFLKESFREQNAWDS
jgi:hypothetical protein